MVDKSLEELQDTFDYFDSDNNGRIDLSEFTRILEALQSDMTPEESRIGFQVVDSDGDGLIDFNEFKDWWASR